jgi:HK97 family phage portal protein
MAFTVSGGAVQQVYKPQAALSTSVRLSDAANIQYAELWKTQPQIRTVVSFLARNVAQLGLHVYKRISDTDRERVTDHPLSLLLAKPNPFTTGYELMEAVMSDLGIYDNALLLKVKLPDQPMALLRLDPSRVTPTGDNPFVATGYKIGKQEFKPEDVIHFHGYSPLDARWGVSPMETLRVLLAEDYQATLYREQLWRNGARMAGYLKRPAGAPAWSDTGKERFRAQWQQQYSGTGARAGGTPILEDGMEYVPASTSPRDAQSVEFRKLTREEVVAAYHIPAPLVGILEHATYSNITEQHKMLYQDCLGPYLQAIQQRLMLTLLPDFGDAADMYVEFNLGEKLRGSFEEQAEVLARAVGAPYMLRNEARARLNLGQIDGGDDLVTPLNLLIGDASNAAVQAELARRGGDTPAPADGDGTQQVPKAPVRALRAVEGE